MNDKLQKHVNILWAAAPKNAKADEIKEELLRNLDDKYNDLLTDGYDQAAAFHIALSGIGDLDELFRECGGTVRCNTVTHAASVTHHSQDTGRQPYNINNINTMIPAASVTPPVIVSSKPSNVPMALALAFILAVLGPGLCTFWTLWGAVGLGVFSLFFCWAIASGSFIYAIASLFNGNESSLRKGCLVLVIILLAFIVFGVVSKVVFTCVPFFFPPWNYGYVPTGPIVVQEREISGDFTLIDIQSAIPVEFKLSDKNRVVVETHEDVMPFISTNVCNGSLVIHHFAHQFRNIKTLRVTVHCQTFPQSFFVSGASHLTCTEPIQTESVSFDCSGAGKIYFKNLDSKKAANFRITGASVVDIAGKSESVFLHASGASKLLASDFDMERCEVIISGASQAELGTITEEISINSSGASHLDYRGSPTVRKR